MLLDNKVQIQVFYYYSENNNLNCNRQTYQKIHKKSQCLPYAKIVQEKKTLRHNNISNFSLIINI